MPERIWEVIIGHCTFLGLQERGCPSTFTIYPFIRKYYYTSDPLWDSAREELVCFLGLMYFLQSSWRLPWSPIVTASDASPSGYAVCIGTWPQQKSGTARTSSGAYALRCENVLLKVISGSTPIASLQFAPAR